MINLDRSLPMVVPQEYQIGLTSPYDIMKNSLRIRRQCEGVVVWGLVQMAPPENREFEEFFLKQFAKHFALPMSFLTGEIA